MPTNDQPEDVCELSVFPASSRTSGEKRKRKSDSSDDEALKPYECRFCPMKFAKSQALGGHMNRHRQEREREQLLHARQLVLQQGLSWMSGQNKQQLGSRLSAGPLPPQSLQSNFQLSSSLQSSLSWNISGAQQVHHKLADDESCNHNMSSLMGGSQSSSDNMLSPFMVDQHAGPGFGDNSDMLTMPCGDRSKLQVPLECTYTTHALHASPGGDENEEHVRHQLDGERPLQLALPDPTESPGPQLVSGTSELQLLSEHLAPLQMAVDCECPQQLLSLGGYQNGGFSTDEVAAPWDGFSWIFNNNSQIKPAPPPLNEDHGFCLALGNNQQQHWEQVENNGEININNANHVDEEDCIAEAAGDVTAVGSAKCVAVEAELK